MIFGAVGAVVEWYDLMLYGYLAVVFARVFFPPDASPGVALAATLGGFAIGFLMRPVGGFFFGWLGDAHGRKLALMTAISMMSIPMIATALLPGYDAWGWAAPAILIFLRMVQGFSSGGEYSGTLVLLAENARSGHRGRVASIAAMFSGIGILLASLAAAILTNTLTDAQLDSWGWRIAYAFGALIIFVGIVMRTKMTETPRYAELAEAGGTSEQPIRDAVVKHWRAITVIILLAGYTGIAYFIVLTYLVSYLETTVGLSHDTALVLGTVSAFLFAATAYLFGWLSDKVGRKPPMFWSAIALAILAWPMFELLGAQNLAIVYLANCVLLVPVFTFNGAFYVVVTELLPTRERNAGLGIGYNVGTAVLGSTAPAIAQVLVNVTGNPTVPAFYLIAASILILPVIWFLPETAFKDLSDNKMAK